MKKSYIQVNLGKRVKELRKIKGFSQEQFAEKIGIATNTLSSIERGNAFMTAQTLEKIIEILEIIPEDLFKITEHKSKTDIYSEILTKLNLIKNDTERLNIMHKFINSLV